MPGKNFKTPLAIYFVWHPSDQNEAKPLVDYCFEKFRRNTKRPFSRSMNLPVFFRTSSGTTTPNRGITDTATQQLAFVFLSKNIVADKAWTEYISSLKCNGVKLILVSLDDLAYNFPDPSINNLNYIRYRDFDQTFIKPLFFIEAAHEVYRMLRTVDGSETTGNDTAIKLFLSHAKADEWSVRLAKQLKQFIDNSRMNNFFDAVDIAPAYRFDDEIEAHLKESTIIAIYSDNYSSRYWCQREVMSAKKNCRPMLAVDHLKDFDDRLFPYFVNIPSIHLHSDHDSEQKEIYKILEAALLETVRFFYQDKLLHTHKDCNEALKDAHILTRPPVAIDILALDNDLSQQEEYVFLYPEPPVYSDELEYMKKLKCRALTPLSFGAENFKGSKVGISISGPEQRELQQIGHDESHLKILAQDLARHLLIRQAHLIYGGDLRQDGFTEFLFEEASALSDRVKNNSQPILTNYLSWPIYNNDTVDIITWKAQYAKIAEMISVPHCSEIETYIQDAGAFIPPNTVVHSLVWSKCLTKMRKEMIANCDSRICAGGKLSGYKGSMPGVLEEIVIAIQLDKPLYILGGFGGVTEKVANLLKGDAAEELSREWQENHTNGYRDLLNFSESGITIDVDYKNIESLIQNYGIKEISERNGLSEKDNLKLFETQYVDEAIHLILKGINAREEEQ